MGINARKALHPRWVSHHIRTIDGFKNCDVKIVRRTGIEPELNTGTGLYTNLDLVFEDVYSGRARVQPYGLNFDIDLANESTSRRLILVQLEGKNLGIRNDDILSVTGVDEDNNLDLMDYTFDIRGSVGSSLEWGTNLVAEINLKGGLT